MIIRVETQDMFLWQPWGTFPWTDLPRVWAGAGRHPLYVTGSQQGSQEIDKYTRHTKCWDGGSRSQRRSGGSRGTAGILR